jgi:hypothetical protein
MSIYINFNFTRRRKQALDNQYREYFKQDSCPQISFPSPSLILSLDLGDELKLKLLLGCKPVTNCPWLTVGKCILG